MLYTNPSSLGSVKSDMTGFSGDMSARGARRIYVRTELDGNLWCSLVGYAAVYDKDDVRFTFKDGTEIQA